MPLRSIRYLLAIFLCTLSFGAFATQDSYPSEWWAPVDPSTAPSWEILPQEAKEGEVILSKRTELGIFSNFSATPFKVDDEIYASVEGFWQLMKYPDYELENDPRKNSQFIWELSRKDVASLSGFEAKSAGNVGSEVMKKLEINWVSFKGQQMIYRTPEKGEHYDLIRKAMKAKLEQTEGLKELLLKTGSLILLPDHDQGASPPPAWKYFEIWMEFRDELAKRR